MRINRSTLKVCLALCFLGTAAQATIINVGALSYDTFIPVGGGSPGVDAFDIANLTGAFNLPPDFPAADSLTFMGAVLTLTLSDATQQIFDLGDIVPGFLLDGGGNPVVQVPGDQTFTSAEFTATLSPTTFTLSDGTSFKADTATMDIFLLPSSGGTLTVDVDQTALGVSGSSVVSTPEPRTVGLALIGLLSCVLFWRGRVR